MNTLNITLGEKILLLRRRQNLTQGQLAKKLLICQTVISQVETGHQELDHSEIISFAKALNVQPSVLLNSIPNQGCRPRKVRNEDA
jgi:transcriptional regulator with XRE-family HTH domain